MTDEEKLAAAQALDDAYAKAEAFDRAQVTEANNEDKLDAYGHLEWTVGNEDWVACFDAVRVPDGIAYHVVVDCESGGFTETTESGTTPLSEAVAELASLPWRYADSFIEQGYDEELDLAEIEDCAKRWEQHLLALVATPEPECEEEHESDDYAELGKAALNHRGHP